jgi:predicted transcriptional regulator
MFRQVKPDLGKKVSESNSSAFVQQIFLTLHKEVCLAVFPLASITSITDYTNLSNRRDRLAIMCEILIEARTALIKTRIMYKCNLSYKQLTLYIEMLLKKKLLSKKIDDDGRERFVTTQKGNRFIGKFQNLQALLQERIVQPLT